MRILLGPSHELHAGIHGALTDAPASGIEYVERSYLLHFQHDKTLPWPFSPTADHCQCEWINFQDESGIDLIHSARFPVESDLPWVVDADCMLLPLQIGGFFALGLHHGAPYPGEERIRKREAAMLSRYASRQCRGIMLRSERAKRQFLQRAEDNALVDDLTRDALFAKTTVIYPAVEVRPCRANSSIVPTIMFMGRTFVDKGGLLAVAVFEQLRARLGQAFQASVVADCPRTVQERLASLDIEVVPTMDRNAYLDRFNQTDIFFSPTLFESFGMALIEAAAAGTAIVTSSGPGMEHINELFRDGFDAILVSNALEATQRVALYTQALTNLIRDPSARQSLSANARVLASTGRLSLGHHNDDMASIYRSALSVDSLSLAPSKFYRASSQEPASNHVLTWSEQTCHWARQRHIPSGGLRICL